MLVAYVERDYGGAYECLKKTQQKDKLITLITNNKSG